LLHNPANDQTNSDEDIISLTEEIELMNCVLFTAAAAAAADDDDDDGGGGDGGVGDGGGDGDGDGVDDDDGGGDDDNDGVGGGVGDDNDCGDDVSTSSSDISSERIDISSQAQQTAQLSITSTRPVSPGMTARELYKTVVQYIKCELTEMRETAIVAFGHASELALRYSLTHPPTHPPTH